MEEALLKTCQDIEQRLDLNFRERRSHADFWACKGVLRGAVATYESQVEPQAKEICARPGVNAEVVARVTEACVNVLLKMAQAASSLADLRTAEALLSRAQSKAQHTPLEETVRQARQKADEQDKDRARNPWG